MSQVVVMLWLTAALTSASVDPAPGPEPSPTPVSWELDLKYEHPQRIEVQLPGEASPTVYWYMVYTVTNNEPRTIRFFPTFQLVTGDLRVLDTDIGISPLVFNAIKERHKLTHPYLVSPSEAIGDLLKGDDHARQSVAIWRAGELDVNSFRVFVAGLSGETRFVANPAHDATQPETATVTDDAGRPREQAVNPAHFTLRKTLELRYELPGSAGARAVVRPVFSGQRWIMR
jgi:hypothetical protein